MLLAVNIPALVSSPCPSLPLTFPSATAKQQHERYHLPWGLFNNTFSLYRFPSPSSCRSPSRPQSPSLSPSHPLFPSLSRSLSHRPVYPPHSRHCHCHCDCQDGSFHRFAHHNLPSSHHQHPRRLSHLNSVVQWPGSGLVCTAGSLAARSVPWDHRYRTKWNTHQCV